MKNEPLHVSPEKLPSLLLAKYKQDFNLACAEFPQNHRIELIEHLMAVNAICYAFYLNPNPDLQMQFTKADSSFITKHGKVAQTFNRLKMHLYFNDEFALAEKGVYTPEEWSDLPGEKQKLSPEGMRKFMALCNNFLIYEREYLWLEQSPDYPTSENQIPQSPLAGAATKAAEEAENKRRMALDKATALSQEQTVLLLHYLKEIKVFLRENNLNNKDAGIAFGILTGYSHDTIRQKLGRVETIQTHDNLEFLYNYTVRLQKAIDTDLKKLKKPE